MALPTVFQKLATDHVSIHQEAAPLDYPKLKAGRFESVYFRPEEGVDYVSQRIDYCIKQDTFRGTKFAGNVWFADPISADSVAAGIPTNPDGYANYIVDYVKALTAKGYKPEVLKVNAEFSFKGYPPWKPSIPMLPWMKVWARAAWDNVPRLYVTSNPGTTGTRTPQWSNQTGKITRDGTIIWNIAETPYSYWQGWDFNEKVAKIIRTGLPDVNLIVQPMAHQEDFNRGAWHSRKSREAPQCYGDQPYLALTDPGAEIQLIDTDRYAKAYYKLDLDRRKVHPTIGAYGQGNFYVPRIKAARSKGIFGFVIYRADGFAESDFQDYAQFAIT